MSVAGLCAMNAPALFLTGVFLVISVIDIFKIGIGPSSSHTVGPMKIARDFAEGLLRECPSKTMRLRVRLHGALALTGRGHNTDGAVVLGLAGFEPHSVDAAAAAAFLRSVRESGRICPLGFGHDLPFAWDRDIIFDPTNLPLHENGMILTAESEDGGVWERTYYSTGGGFFCRAEEFSLPGVRPKDERGAPPYPFSCAEDVLEHCEARGISLSELALRNELAFHDRSFLDSYFADIWRVMQESMERGMQTEGFLPGPLKLPRRAPALRRRLASSNALAGDPMNIIDWINMFAFAASEENASGGRVVTAPTNGACGIVPAVLAYYNLFVSPVTPEVCGRYFMASGVIGAIYKMNASISGAEVGCQGEVGVACSMAAAGLAELSGGSPGQVCAAAEIAMEHNLGLTCDPVGGFVQVPCIERNAIMAVKAVNAARMALLRTDAPRVSLDKVIKAMNETGRDMNAKYRETSQGGLAKNVACE